MKNQFVLFYSLLILSLLIGGRLFSQDRVLNSATNTNIYYQCAGTVVDDGGSNANFTLGKDYWMTICSERTYPITNPIHRQQISLQFEEFDMGDAIINIYTGRGITNSLIWNWENQTDFSGNDLVNRTIISAFEDTTGCFTIRMRSDAATTTGTGFKAEIECVKRCQYPMAALDTVFYKVDEEGNMSMRPVRDGLDTIWLDSTKFEVQKYKSVDFCIGDSIILVAKPLYPDNDTTIVGNDTIITQSISTSLFVWDFGDSEMDSVYYNNVVGYKWSTLGGYDLNLKVVDTNNGGCVSRNMIDTRVRIAMNPIKTVSPLPDLCSGQIFNLNVGYGGSSTINVDSIVFPRAVKQSYDSVVFIPDGPNCPPGYYEAPVTFDEFASGALIKSVDDIKSICINMEHSYLGDLGFEVECPNGSKVVLKWNTYAGSADLGIPGPGSNGCLPANNPAGTGWTYCFSNQYLNGQRGVISGNMPSPIVATNVDDTIGYFQTPVQTGQSFTGTNGSCSGPLCETVDLNGFSPLIGCPINGEWKLRVIDNWGIDNGYVFWWDMELGHSAAANWEYQVAIDTVIWTGNFITPVDNVSSMIAPPIEDCGLETYDIKIVDEFGCVWDTITTLDILCTPVVDLGEDIELCETKEVVLNAGDPLPHGITTYVWEPTGENTQRITAQAPENANSIIKYTVQVTNSNGLSYCYGGDSINLIIYPSAMASFSLDKFPLEGCEPLDFKLNSTSTNAATYDWIIGTHYSNEANPSFTLPYGTYDLKLKVTSEHGCVDSIIQNQLIHVYKSPVADFGWLPNNPSVTYPTANFVNLTTPKDPSNQYHWSIQAYDGSPELRENVFGFEPSYTWKPLPGTPVYGDYYVTLDAYSVNNAPSGFVYECHDTISKRITIINDLLLFPTVVTPNGDGVNDIFYIKNLIEGQAFPDNELAIYNRLGRRVFFKQDIRNKEDFWDPALTNSPTGTYFYRFIGRGSIRDVELKGAVEVLK